MAHLNLAIPLRQELNKQVFTLPFLKEMKRKDDLTQ